MKITPEEVAHVAGLARLSLAPEQAQKLTGEMNAILSAMDKLREVDTSALEATATAALHATAMRPDQARPSLGREKGLANAPADDGQSFIVPKVI